VRALPRARGPRAEEKDGVWAGVGTLVTAEIIPSILKPVGKAPGEPRDRPSVGGHCSIQALHQRTFPMGYIILFTRNFGGS
jgi:hypothetical protein